MRHFSRPVEEVELRGETVIHVVPSVTCPDGVQDYQRVLVCQIAKVLEQTSSEIRLQTATLAQTVELVRRVPSPIIHFQLPMRAWKRFVAISFYPFLCRCLRRDLKIVLTLHEWGGSKLLRRAVNFPALLLTDLIICPTSDIAEEIKGIGRQLRRRKLQHSQVIPIGPNLLWNGKPAERGPGSPVRIGYFGLLYPGKLPLRMLGILREIAARVPDVKLVMVGHFIPEQAGLEKRFWLAVSEMRLSQNIEWHGYVPNPSEALDVLATCDAFLLLNARGFTERNGSALTCLQFGKPIVASAPIEDAHPRADWIQECVSAGLLSFIDDEQEASEAADTVLKAVRPKSGTAGVAFSPLWTEIASRHVAIYKTLSASRTTGVKGRQKNRGKGASKNNSA